jgi:hypothetical protein
MMKGLRRLAWILVTIGACSGDGVPVGESWVVERQSVGDTLVVRTISGSVWGEPIEMVEDFSIGALDGPEELLFTWIGAIAVDQHGGIYVFDWQVPALRYFDADGRYVRTLGREGRGPGEYGSWSNMFFQFHQLPGQQRELTTIAGALTVRQDGMVLLADLNNVRLNLYRADGSYSEQWSMPGGMYSRQGIAVDTAGRTYISIGTRPIDGTAALDVAYQRLDADGSVLDTIRVPTLEGEPEHRALLPTDPTKEHAVSPLGHMIVGVTDDYVFDVRPPDGPTVRIEKVYEPVGFGAEELAEWQAVIDWLERLEHPGQVNDVRSAKLAYHSFLTDRQGRIWVRLHVAARKDEATEVTSREYGGPPLISWVEPAVYDVFEPDGTYLGEVHFPWSTWPLLVHGDTAWGVRRGDSDEQYVVRLVMVR